MTGPEQEHLLQVLFEELHSRADPEVDRAWLEEAKRRMSITIISGTPRALEQVIDEYRARKTAGVYSLRLQGTK